MSDQDLLYLSQKRVLLANPGTKLDNIYYNKMNTIVEMSEVTYNHGRLSIALSTRSFGSQSQVIIPNNNLLSDTYLHLELADLVADQTICRAWGYAMINNITYLFGSSNVSQQQIRGDTLLHTIMGQCNNSEKRNELFRLAGQEKLAPDGNIMTADLLLPLPWSSASGEHDKKPFDTNLLNNPITVTVTFNRAEAVYGGNGVRPSQFNIATMYFKQGELRNKDQSLRVAAMKSPNLKYGYPFIHHQSYSPAKFTGVISGGQISIPLLSFINADLLGITIGCVRDSRKNPTANNSPSPFAYDVLKNIRLQFNGQNMYDAPGEMFKLINMSSQTGSSFYHNSIIQSGAVAPFNSDPVDSYLLYIDFSRVRALSYDGQYQNVWRIGNNTLTLEFNTETTEQYTMFASYNYNGIAEVQRGETRIFFD